jgi:hypothetical protein
MPPIYPRAAVCVRRHLSDPILELGRIASHLFLFRKYPFLSLLVAQAAQFLVGIFAVLLVHGDRGLSPPFLLSGRVPGQEPVHALALCVGQTLALGRQ